MRISITLMICLVIHQALALQVPGSPPSVAEAGPDPVDATFRNLADLAALTMQANAAVRAVGSVTPPKTSGGVLSECSTPGGAKATSAGPATAMAAPATAMAAPVTKTAMAAPSLAIPKGGQTGAPGGTAGGQQGAGLKCDDASMPKCITFRANRGNEPPTCSQNDALIGFTLEGKSGGPQYKGSSTQRGPGDNGQAAPADAKHVFAYTHGFCGPTGSGGVGAGEAEWCKNVAAGCGLTYSESDPKWKGKEGANCLIKFIAENAPTDKPVHFEIDNCSTYKGDGQSQADVQCYHDLIDAMKQQRAAGKMQNMRIAFKNISGAAFNQTVNGKKLKDYFKSESHLLSNFVLVEEKFMKDEVQRELADTCASVAQSMNTYDYKFNENHIKAGGGGQTPAAGPKQGYLNERQDINEIFPALTSKSLITLFSLDDKASMLN